MSTFVGLPYVILNIFFLLFCTSILTLLFYNLYNNSIRHVYMFCLIFLSFLTRCEIEATELLNKNTCLFFLLNSFFP